MKVTITKDSSIPIRDQIIEQISLQIASGQLKGGEKLPSIRALAGRLDIHYSTVTAAYNHLADTGLLEIRQGSGVRVSSAEPVREELRRDDLSKMFADFLALAAESGYSLDEVKNATASLKDRPEVRRILAVDRNEDFHQVLKKELEPHFSIPIEVMTVDSVKDNQELLADSLVVTSLYHLFSFKEIIKDRTRLVPCNIEPARLEMEKVGEMRSGSLLMLVSVSKTLMSMAERLVAAARGEEVAVRMVELSDQKELSYMVGYADLILCDRPSEETMRTLTGGEKLHIFSLYSDSTIELIKKRLAKWG